MCLAKKLSLVNEQVTDFTDNTIMILVRLDVSLMAV
jgi:hypothetical protein